MKPLYWLKHCGSWFAFDEPAHFEFDSVNGGYFANSKGEHIYSVLHCGPKIPFEYR